MDSATKIKMRKIPLLPLSALIFYLLLVFLWNTNLIPPPNEFIEILEKLYQQYGYAGLILATFLEGTAYICLYFPGAFIIALTVFFSDRSLVSLVIISLIVSITLTVAAFVDYFLGRYFSSRINQNKKGVEKEKKILSKGLFVSMLHPNFLAFYFFNSGLRKKNFRQIFYVPLFMFPYGIVVAFILSIFSNTVRNGLESPMMLFTILVIWFVVAYLKINTNHQSKLNRKSTATKRY